MRFSMHAVRHRKTAGFNAAMLAISDVSRKLLCHRCTFRC